MAKRYAVEGSGLSAPTKPARDWIYRLLQGRLALDNAKAYVSYSLDVFSQDNIPENYQDAAMRYQDTLNEIQQKLCELRNVYNQHIVNSVEGVELA